MIGRDELIVWLANLPQDASVAIDEGGLTLIEVGGKNYFEIGGAPEKEESK